MHNKDCAAGIAVAMTIFPHRIAECLRVRRVAAGTGRHTGRCVHELLQAQAEQMVLAFGSN